MNGHQVSEEVEADLYTLMVPVEETLLQPDPDSKQGAVKFNYVLSERDYFDAQQLIDLDMGLAGAKANCITLEGLEPGQKTDDQMRMSISCQACCVTSP